MNLVLISTRNLRRNKFRSFMTIAGVAVAVLTFVLLHTVNKSIRGQADPMAQGMSRLYATNRVSWYLPIPKKYAQSVPEGIEGVTATSFTVNFNGKLPSDPSFWFQTLAVDSATFFDVLTEGVLDPDSKRAWLEDRQGAVIGVNLAKKLNLKVGDKLALKGTLYPGDWTFNVRGIYTTNKDSWDRTSVFIHYAYLNESIPTAQRDQINWVAMTMPAGKTSTAASQIERAYLDREVPLRSFSHDDLSKQLGSMFSSVVRALNLMSFAILGILAMVLGNTIATSVRERTRETGMLRAVGFTGRKIALLIVGESLALAMIGGLVGLGIAYPLVQLGLGKVMRENADAIFPTFRILNETVAMAIALPVILGIFAAALPAIRTLRIKVVDALRHVE